MWSTFFVSLKLTELLNIYFLINWNLDNFCDISVNFEGKKMEDHILEIPRLLVFSCNCFKCDNTKSYLRNNPAWNKGDVEVVI